MEVQNLDSAERGVRGVLRRERGMRLTTLYRRLRDNANLTFYGDYPLLSYALEQIVCETGRRFTRKQLVTALNMSKDLNSSSKSEKMNLLNNLEGIQKLCLTGLNR